jgi:hypothetical protein
MKHFTGRNHYESQAAEAAPLGSRLGGYDSTTACAYWNWLGPEGRQAERRFLKADLAFPFVYGGTLLTSLLLVWGWLGRPFNRGWLALPVAITVLADWLENLVQCEQLNAFVHFEPVQSDWIQVASVATTTKLVFLGISSLLLIGLTAWWVVRALGPGE